MPRKSIFNHGTLPDTSGNVFMEPYTVKASNGVWGFGVWIFIDTATRDGLRGRFFVPDDYASGANLVVVWTSTATSNDVEWDFDYRAVGGDDAESLDQAGTQESVNANDTAPSAIHERMEITIPLTDANFAPGDEVEFELFRDGADAGDLMAGPAILLDALFEWTAT